DPLANPTFFLVGWLNPAAPAPSGAGIPAPDSAPVAPGSSAQPVLRSRAAPPAAASLDIAALPLQRLSVGCRTRYNGSSRWSRDAAVPPGLWGQQVWIPFVSKPLANSMPSLLTCLCPLPWPGCKKAPET